MVIAMGKRGAQPAKIDWPMVDKMLHIQCIGEEIASVIGVSYDTLERACKRDHGMKFADYSEQKRMGGRASLRRMQWKTADSGNPTMQIWLGKQMLGQRDKIEQDNTSSDGSMTPQVVERVIVNPQKAE